MSLVAGVVVLPLLGAALASVAWGRSRLQAVISLVCLGTTAAISVVLAIEVDRNGITTAWAGGWRPPMGIALVADRFSTILLVVATAMLLGVLIYALGQGGRAARHPVFHPAYLVLTAGVACSFVTGDLFNLFVAFEMMLAASYVLLTLGGRPDQVRAGMTYVLLSLSASAVFLILLGLVYSATGTLNMADLSGRLDQLDPAVSTGFGVMMLLVFGVKAGLFPLFSWLPDSYPTAPGPVTAIFAGLLTKVGIYAIIRTQTLIVPADDRQALLILLLAALTMGIGVMGAIAQDDMKRILSFHIVSQVGYMVLGLGLFTIAGLAGAVFYIVHHIIVKTALFLVAGLVERCGGSCRLSAVGGLVRTHPVVAVLFAVPALSLAGIPPLSGFVAKFALIDAGIEAREWWTVAVALSVGLLTLFSMTKIWAGVFWGTPDEPVGEPADPGLCGGGSKVMLGATVAVCAMSVAVSVFAGSLWRLSERTATELLDRDGYVRAVLETTP